MEEAMYLSKFARKVTVIHRRNELRAAKSIQEKAFKNPKLHFMWDTVVDEVDGEELLSKMVVRNTKTGALTTIEADPEDGFFGLFGFIGLLPNTKLFEGVIDMENGYIKTDADMHTNIPGVFAAGDLRVKSLRQVVTARQTAPLPPCRRKNILPTGKKGGSRNDWNWIRQRLRTRS